VAATEALAVPATATLDEAARLLVDHRLDQALVADASGRPAGTSSSLEPVAHPSR
jgi:CBS domain-containing protein